MDNLDDIDEMLGDEELCKKHDLIDFKNIINNTDENILKELNNQLLDEEYITE